MKELALASTIFTVLALCVFAFSGCGDLSLGLGDDDDDSGSVDSSQFAGASDDDSGDGRSYADDDSAPADGQAPPAEAVDACDGLAEGDDCSFVSEQGDDIAGHCCAIEDVIACVPQDGPPPPDQGN